MDVKVDGLPEREHQAQLRRAIIASTIGTAIEWYDFFLYSTVTGLVFAKIYLSTRWALPRGPWEPPSSATMATAWAARRP